MAVKQPKNRFGLIIQPGAIGDMILTLPLVRLLKRRWGLDKVDIMGHLERLRLLQGRSEVHQALSLEQTNLHRLFEDHQTFDLPENDPLIDVFRNYELIISFLSDKQGNFEQNLIFTTCITHAAEVIILDLMPPDDYPHHAACFFMSPFAHQGQLQLTEINEYLAQPMIKLTSQEIQSGRALLSQAGLPPDAEFATIHPGSGSERKCWDINNFLILSEKLRAKNLQVVFLLGPTEMERWDQEKTQLLAQNALVIPEAQLSEIAAILFNSRIYIGNDSGISHLAGALGVATVAIFGISKAHNWRPLGKKVKICGSQDGWPSVDEVLSRVKELI